jgi:predicted DNA-binding ribbon-helix-helix protein
MLKAAAAREGVALAALVARIDGERIKATPAPGLAGAIRTWLVADAIRAAPLATAPSASKPTVDQ